MTQDNLNYQAKTNPHMTSSMSLLYIKARTHEETLHIVTQYTIDYQAYEQETPVEIQKVAILSGN